MQYLHETPRTPQKNPPRRADRFKEGYSFPVALADARHATAFGGVSRLPTSIFINKHGWLRKKINGQVYYGRLEDLVGALLKD